jgi:TRAP transporter TAXI family solute receptor
MSITRRSLLAGLSVATAYAIKPGSSRLLSSTSGQPLVIATGSTLGVYYRYGQALATLLRGQGADVTVLPTSASVENIELLARGRVQLGFTALDAAVDAGSGRPPFDAVTPVLALARLYDDYIHLVVPHSSPASTVGDLHGMRVSLGPANSGTALIAARVLEAAGLDAVQDVQASSLDLNGSAIALQQGHVDAFFWSGGLPTSGIAALAAVTPIRLVPMHDEATALRSQYGSYYRAGTIPADTYTSIGDVDTIAIADLLATTSAMDADMAARITRTLFSGRRTIATEVPIGDRLDERTAIFTEPISLHPGALRYYRDVKSNG